MAQLRIGTSGWNYPDWNDRFYPTGLPRRAVLAYASRRFNSVEVNGSFYSLLRPETYRRWYDQTPRGFLFALKGSRFITHNKKLLDVDTPLANFFASGLLLLREKLGPIVWQFPATTRCDGERFDAFFTLLPRDTEAAVRLAQRHDSRVAGRAWTSTDRCRRIRYAVEVRSPACFTPDFVALLRRHRIALVVSDAATWRRVEDVTAGFVYLRLHGAERTYASAYSVEQLRYWAARVARWRAGGEPDDAMRISAAPSAHPASRDVFVYFDNDYEANAPTDASRLAILLGQSDPNRGDHDAIIAEARAASTRTRTTQPAPADGRPQARTAADRRPAAGRSPRPRTRHPDRRSARAKT